jgi:hypothetical protein
MRCIQDTTQVAGVFTALEWDGLAPDAAFAGLPPVLAHRLHIAVGEEHHRCCGAAGIELVAVQADDPALPEQTRRSLRDLAPGHAIAATALAELAGGWIAMPGVNLRIATTADLGDDHAVAISLADAVALLRAPGGDRLLVRTAVICNGTPDAIPPGWHVVAGSAA